MFILFTKQSFSHFYKPYHHHHHHSPHHHSVNSHLLTYLNHPNQHLLFVNRLIAQNPHNNSSPNGEQHLETNFTAAAALVQQQQQHQQQQQSNQLKIANQPVDNNCSSRLPNSLSVVRSPLTNTKYQKRKFNTNHKSKAIEKTTKTHFVSRIVAKIKANKLRLAMYRNSSTSTSLQSQSTINPQHGSFHKPGSNVALAWQDINVYKPIPIVDQLAFRLNTNVLGCDEHNLILKQLNGVIKFGEVLAIMGPSGAGKSLLIQIQSFWSLSGHFELFQN